jgi:hypothetical protein
MNDLAHILEHKGAESGEYPPDWDIIATWAKSIAGWRCERCGADWDSGVGQSKKGAGFTLTVHHLDGNKWNCELWNLAVLCQRCHLRIQARVEFYRDSLDGVHSYWMAKHVKGYNVDAQMFELTPLKLERITIRSYEKEWPKV